MRTNRTLMHTAAPLVAALAAVALGGCGLFKTSGTSGKYEVNDPDRVAARVVANVIATTPYSSENPANKAVFNALLYDADGRQFYGPELLFNGEVVEPDTTRTGPARYVKGDVDYATGQTYTVAVQGHTATTPSAPPPMRVTAPARTDPTDPAKNYFVQPEGQGVTISWTGGDPNRPVYIVINGDPTSQNGRNSRRLFVRDNPQQSPVDPENYGLPITNTGSFTIPAELTERVMNADGTTPPRTIPTFANPMTNPRATDVRVFAIFVVQRTDVVKNGPLEVSAVSIATATAGVNPNLAP